MRRGNAVSDLRQIDILVAGVDRRARSRTVDRPNLIFAAHGNAFVRKSVLHEIVLDRLDIGLITQTVIARCPYIIIIILTLALSND